MLPSRSNGKDGPREQEVRVSAHLGRERAGSTQGFQKEPETEEGVS